MAATTKINPHVGSRSRCAAEANVYAHPSRTSKTDAAGDGGDYISGEDELTKRVKKVPTGEIPSRVCGETSTTTARGGGGRRDGGDEVIDRRRRGDGAGVAGKMAALLAEADAAVSSLNTTSKEKWTKNNNSSKVAKGALDAAVVRRKGSRSRSVGTSAGASTAEKDSTEDVLAAVEAALNASRAQTASRPVALRLKGPRSSRSVVITTPATTTTVGTTTTTTTASDKLRVIDNVLDDLARTLPSRLASSSTSTSTSFLSSSSSGASAAPAAMLMTAPCRGIVVGVAESSAPSTAEFTRDALSYDFLKLDNTRERVRMTMYYRDMMDVRLEETKRQRGHRQSSHNNAASAAVDETSAYVLSFRVAKTLDRFMGSYVPSNPSHRLSIGFVSTDDAVRCGEEVLPLMRRVGK